MQITNGTKNVAFIGIKHLTKPKDLAKFKRDIDSLRDDGYTIMYEGVHIGTKDSVVEDVIRRKFRRVTGFNLSAYLDATNIIANIFKVDGVIERSRYDEDICADYSIDSIVLKYEELKGPIILSKCDYQTRLDNNYSCTKTDRQNIIFMTQTLSDNKLLAEIIRHPNNKIAVLFGAAHRQDLYEKLKKHESSYTITHAYN